MGRTATHIFLVLAALVALLINGCAYPKEEFAYQSFNVKSGWSANDTVKFELDMCDTPPPLKLDIIGHITTDTYLNKIKGYPINIFFYTPDNQVFTDSLTLPVNIKERDNIIKRGHHSMEILWSYRRNILNDKPGKWHIEFTQAAKDSINYKNIIGLGISITKDER